MFWPLYWARAYFINNQAFSIGFDLARSGVWGLGRDWVQGRYRQNRWVGVQAQVGPLPKRARTSHRTVTYRRKAHRRTVART